MTIVLCRHGVTDANAAGTFLSRENPPLNAEGRKQSEHAYAALRALDFRRGFCSPMRRCIETFEIVAPDVAYRREAALREVDFGSWEGKTLEWLALHDAAGLAQRKRDPVTFRPPGGESFADASQRLRAVAHAVMQLDGNVLIVAHRGSLGVLERLLRGIPLESRAVAPLEPGEFHIIDLE
ncbi:MAG: histidine phosphatase family protein [Candidatus Eremiobacteraeota bacterium]|nr:histidine phosphatase family protein [Candidatus Eremiobacteraeota bacterium]